MIHYEEISSTHEQVLAYESRLKQVLDEEGAHREAKLREEEARREGEHEGKKAGIKEGKQEKKEEIARRFLAKGMDIEVISEETGLERERVIEIQ